MKLTRLLHHNESYLFLIIVVFSAVITVVNPVFFSLENLFDLLRSSAGTTILAVGVFIVLLSGGIDVSITAIAICCQYIAITTLISSGLDNLPLVFLISIAIGISLGAINGVLIGVFKLPTLITTLGTSSLFHGLLLEFVGTRSINTGDLPESIKEFGKATILSISRGDGTQYGLSVFVPIVAVTLLVTWGILRYTMVGRGIHSLGGNIEAARRTGYNVTFIQFFIYCYSGILAGIAGILHLSLIRYSNPNYLVGTELNIIAAVVLGGTRITGGRGTMTGTILGVALITILQKNLVLMGLSSYWQEFFVGLIIVLGVSITHLQGKFESRKRPTGDGSVA